MVKQVYHFIEFIYYGYGINAKHGGLKKFFELLVLKDRCKSCILINELIFNNHLHMYIIFNCITLYLKV